MAEGFSYYSLASGIRANGIMAYPASPSVPTAYRAPLYPAFLWFFVPRGGQSGQAWATVAQVALYPVAALLVYMPATAMLGPFCGLAAVAVYSFLPGAIRGPGSLGLEFFYSLFLGAIAAFIVLLSRRSRYKKTISVVLCLIVGISLLVKSPLVLFPLVLAFSLSKDPTKGPRARFKKAVAVFLLCYLPLLPWVLRNAVHFRAFIPFERYAAVCNFYTASEGLARSWLPSEAWHYAASNAPVKLSGIGAFVRPRRAWDLTAQGSSGMEKMSASEKDRELLARGISNIVANPLKYARGCIERFILILTFFPFLFLGLAAGLTRHELREDPSFQGLFLLCGCFMFSHTLFSVEERYMFPLFTVLVPLGVAGYFSCAKTFSPGIFQPAGKKGPELAPGFKYFLAACSLAAIGLWFFSTGLLITELRITGFARSNEALDLRETILPERSGPEEVYYNSLGVLAFARGNKTEAEDFFRKALKLKPDYPDPAFSLASLLEASGRNKEALGLCMEVRGRLSAGKRSDSPLMIGLLNEALECAARNLQALGRPAEAASLRSEKNIRLPKTSS